MDLNKIHSAKRTGYNGSNVSDQRIEFQRDFVRIIFSSPFRRLQNKTQVVYVMILVILLATKDTITKA